MDAHTVSVTDVVRNFSDYINRIAYRQESFVLCKGKKPVAELRPLPHGRRVGDLPAIFDSLPVLSPDEAADFADDIAQARVALGTERMRDPWAS